MSGNTNQFVTMARYIKGLRDRVVTRIVTRICFVTAHNWVTKWFWGWKWAKIA